MRLTPEDLARLAAGRLDGADHRLATVPLNGLVMDSRQVTPGAAFIALRGEHEDGHAYVVNAAGLGATLAIVNEAWRAPHDAWLPPLVLRVGDTAAALRRACAAHLATLGCTVVGVTGSVGKTTAKELIAHVCGRLRTSRTPGNLNTWTGVPLSVLNEPGPLDVFVAELAMTAPGEIRDLASMVRPKIGVLLNIGVSHIELLGSQDAIGDAKGELIESLPEDGLAVLNADDERVVRISGRSAAPIAWFGLESAAAAFTAGDVQPDGLRGTSFTLVGPEGSAPARLSVPGTHLVLTACAAAAAASAVGVGIREVAERLFTFTVPDQRGTVRRGAGGSVIYDDSYNSAPASLAAALDVLRYSGARERIAIIGDMLELGDGSIAAHALAGRQAAAAATRLVGVGRHAARVVAAAVRAGMPIDRTEVVGDAEEAAAVVRPLLREGVTVLVKGSHGIHLERTVELIVEGGAR